MNKIFRYAMVAVAAACTLGFASCSDDDDDDNSPAVDQSAVVGTWKYNASESSSDESFTMNGQTVNPSDYFGSDDDDEDSEDGLSNLLDDEFTLTSDGQILSTSGAALGSYSISGSDLTLTEDGQTIKKGATIDMDGASIKVSTCSIAVDGDKLTIKVVAEGSYDLSSLGGDSEDDDDYSFDLGGLSDLLSTNMTIKLTSTSVYDRQN